MKKGMFHIAEQSCRFAIEKFAGWRDTNSTGCPFQQLDSQTVLNSLHLPCDGALSQASNLGGLCKTSVLHDEMKKREFIQIERHCAQEPMHISHQCMRLMNFTQALLRHTLGLEKGKLW